MSDDILDILRRSGRIPVAELARTTGLSYSTARDRLRRLEQQGIIRGYRVLINPEALDLRVHAWVVIDVPDGREEMIGDITEAPATERCYRLVSHPSRLLALVHARDAAGLSHILDRWRLLGATIDDVHLVDEAGTDTPEADMDDALRLLKETELEGAEAGFSFKEDPGSM